MNALTGGSWMVGSECNSSTSLRASDKRLSSFAFFANFFAVVVVFIMML